jgi:hypothetical protein
MLSIARTTGKFRFLALMIGMGLSLVAAPIAFPQDVSTQIMQEAMGRIKEIGRRQVDLTQQWMQNPQVQRDYQQFDAANPNAMTPSEFAYWHMISRGGADATAVQQQQQQQFDALRGANSALQDAYRDQNLGWQQGQQTYGDIYRNYRHNTMGTGIYQDPYTGQAYTLPNTYGPGYYYYGNQPIYQNPAGSYYLPTPSYNYPLYPTQ